MASNAPKSHSAFRRRGAIGLLIVAVVLAFLAFSDDPAIWPVRNTLLYHAERWLSGGEPRQPAAGATLSGQVRNAQGEPAPGARVFVAERDGALHEAIADADGRYRIADLPPDRYAPFASAPGYADTFVRPWGLPVNVGAGVTTTLDITLADARTPAVAPGEHLHIGQPITLTWPLPQPSRAVRRVITYASAGLPDQRALLYTPVAAAEPLPLLLAVYPGPADGWEGVSIPLADEGYAVLGASTAHTLDLEADVAELQRLLAFARAGALPGVDGGRIAVLAGSFSSLHVLRLVDQDVGVRGVVLLGGASDLFDLRRRFEEGSLFPPYNLDQALIALGAPNTEPERYWRYSARYHVRADMPPFAVLHSRNDEIIPIAQSEFLVAELERLGVPREVYFFDGMAHYLLADRPSPELDNLYAVTLAFLDKTMK